MTDRKPLAPLVVEAAWLELAAAQLDKAISQARADDEVIGGKLALPEDQLVRLVAGLRDVAGAIRVARLPGERAP